jgi:hypothetical protein
MRAWGITLEPGTVLDASASRTTSGPATTTVSAGTRHRQRNPGGPSRVRIRHEPAGESEAFFTRLAELSSTGGYDRFGMPRPRAGARLIRDFPDHRSALLPPRAQQALSRLLLRGRS